MSSVILGVAAALSWGVYDFLSRFPSRAVGPIPTVLAVTFFGLLLLSAWVIIGGDGITIVWPKLWLVAVAGIFFALATLALFAAFALGPMTIVAPIVGSYPALAMLFAVAQGARPSAWQWLAIACVMAGRCDHVAERRSLRGVGRACQGRDEKRDRSRRSRRTLLCDRHHRQPGRGADFRRCADGVARQDLRSPHHRPDLSVALAGRAAALAVAAPCSPSWDVSTSPHLPPSPRPAICPRPNSPRSCPRPSARSPCILARVFLKEPIALVQLGGIVLIFGGVASLAAL